MPDTPNHNYNAPELGQENWHTLLNENFEQHDTDIEIRGPESGRSEYEPKQGAKYLATDTGTVYMGDGNSWSEEMVLGVYNSDGNVSLTSAGGSGKVSIEGNIEVSGTKHFVETVDTSHGAREVVYTASESPTPRTETSGVALLDDGRVKIDLPDHFAWVTSDKEPLLVQTTPFSAESGGLAIVERSLDSIVVEDMDGTGDYEFSYTVKGTRAEMENQTVVRIPESAEATVSIETEADD
jgi:hypothetical protein